MKRKASVTVFLSLVMIVFLVLIQVLFHSVQIQGGRLQTETGMSEGLYSVFAEYDRKLFERFHVLFLEGGYGTGQLHMDRPYNIVEACIEESCNPQGKMGIRGENLWNCNVKNSGITGYILASDRNGKVFKEQAAAYMEDTIEIQGVQSLLEQGKEIQENIEKLKWNREKIDEILSGESAEDMEKIVSEPDREEIENIPKDFENPLKLIKEMKAKGILALTVPSEKMISEKETDKNMLYSQRTLAQGMAYETGFHETEKFYRDVLFHKYIMKHFHAFGEKTEDPLNYQLEYIIGGKCDDTKNLKAVTHRLLMLRMMPNISYLMTDNEKRQIVQEISAVIALIFRLPVMEQQIAFLLTAAWAYAESIADVRVLMEGGKIPLMKTDETWKISLEQNGKFVEIPGSGKKETGKDYREYLEMLLWTVSSEHKTERAMDLVELLMRAEEGHRNFKLDLCISSMMMKVNVKCAGKDFSIEREYGYGKSKGML